MRRNSTSKNARLLSQSEEIPCISNQINATENNANLSNDTIPFKTEIQTFMNDTYNEFEFYLQDDKITNSTEKCQKVSTYIDWRGMDYVNLLLSKKENYNISCLVEDWNKKQNSFETHISTETNSICNIGKFHYCPLLNKNNNCTSPYENKDLPISTSLTYNQLNEDIYFNNKTQIIEQRQGKFHNVTHDISLYYFDAYNKDKSELNCAKWSMYIYKRGKLFVNMMNNEIRSEEIYRQDSINTWNSFSKSLEDYTLEQTSNQCNMTELIHKIKERESSNNPYNLAWVLSDNNISGSNETLGTTVSLQDKLQSTSGMPMISRDFTSSPLDNNENTFSSVNNNSTSKNTPISTTLKPTTADDQLILEPTTTASDVTTKINSLTSDTTPEYNLHTTKSSPSSNDPFPSTSIPSDVYPTVDAESNTIISMSSVNVPSSDVNNHTHYPTTITASSSDSSTPPTVVPTPITKTAFFTNDSISSNDTTAHSTKIIEPSKSYDTITITNIKPLTGVSSSSSETSSSPKIINSTTTNSSFTSSSAFPTSSTHKTITLPSANDHRSSSKSNATNSLISIKFSTNNTRSSSAPKSIYTTTSPKSLASSIFNTYPNNVTKSPTTIRNISLLGTKNSETENLKNTTIPIMQYKRIAPLERTYNSALKYNVNVNPSSMTISNNSTMQTPMNNKTEITPTVNPTENVLITVVPIGIFILGIIFLLVLLCRYTPIGSWFRNRKSKKKKIKKKMKEISKEPILMSLNDIESEPIYVGKYSLLHHEKQIPLCEISFERERNLKYRQMKKSKECKEIYRESENKSVYEVLEEVSNYKNESSIEEEKLNKDDTINEIEEDELNESKSGNKIRKEKLIKSGLKKNVVHVVGYTRKNTLNDGETNEINVKAEKSAYEKELKNSENKMSIKNEVCNWNTWANIHIVALLEYKKEEWELYRNEFLKICIEEFEKDEKNTYLKEGDNNLVNIREENVVVMTQKNSSIFEKWKKEEWFINLKKGWKKEEEKHLEYLDEQDIENVTMRGICNLMIDKKKKAWRKWIEKQREYSIEYKKQDWFKKLLEEYEKEVIHKNIKEQKIENISVKKKEKEENNEIEKYEMRKKLTQKMLIDIHMMVLEECEKEELEKEKDELLKTKTEGLGIQENLCEDANILEKIREERRWNSISKKKEEDIEKWKREKWFTELMLEWKDNEQKYIEELNKKMLEKKNEERITNNALERQKIVWKKHWEDIYKKWIENDNKEEWFTKLVDENESKEKEYINEISINNIEKKRENEKPREGGESIIEINGKVKEEVKKFEKTQLEDEDEKINSIIKKKKLKWKTIIEIHMIVLEECKKEEWLLNRGKFLENCLEEFIEEYKEKYPKIIENDLSMIKEKEEDINTLMIEKQKHLWKKWVERNRRMSEKWKKEEWFINLKKEWEKEQEKYNEITKESGIVEIEVGKNPMLEKQKRIWKQWIKKQRMWFIENSKEEWFNYLLDEYEKEEEFKKGTTKGDMRKVNEMKENIEKLEQKENEEIEKCRKKEKLIQKVLIEIHMILLEECKKDELEREKEHFFKTLMKEFKMKENLDEDVNILEKIREERRWNSISKKKEEDIEKWKREKWFIELMLEWKDNEQIYIEELNKKMLEKKNEERITNNALERQKIVWKKHWEDIYKKWIENDNNEEWFTKLVDENESKENEYKSKISKKSIEKKKENGEDGENFDSKIEINNKRKEKVKKYEKTHLDDTDKKINSIIKKKKLKWKTIIEIHMIVLEECKKEEWLVNRGKFLETCLEEFKNEDKEKYPKIMENDLAMMSKGEEDISALMIERQKLLWKKWVERNKRMSEKWKKEEWFIKLKEEWGKEQEKYEELTKESEIVEIEAGKNPMLEKQKRIWKQWIKKQRMWFIENSKEEWFNYLLDEYEKEEEFKKGTTKGDMRKVNEINENVEKLEQKENEEIEKCRKKEKLIQKVLIEIHMILLEECKKEEFEKEKEGFFKTIMEELRIHENSNEDVNITEIKKKSRNIILEKKKEEIEDWKKKKWFIELMLEMKNKEKRYIKEIYEEMIAKKNEDRIKNPMLEKQKTIWKKHLEDIHKKWLEKNNEGCFTTLIY
ncbi:surface-associated interspersed protein (SURFIN) [Plasmodium gallinaceum]|uniref:Surface-associated interspersed protein (SURFIN) n=1 Tax=Plasmodium gallinaceum TaxID=5849 RepID=A0A1J1GPS5_PLAGA|nr:surface-associated interspersed protein (SURFIN) [Plasmodium gallinaceum]CRG94507.1 surface-associated interspersed protein (SURFIN) [Plasmodium gallinaceum]